MFAGIDGLSLALILVIFALGGFVKGVLGFGLPLITMSLLPFVVSVEIAIALSAIVQPATNIRQLAESGGAREAFRATLPILITLAPGTALGAWFLISLDAQIVMRLIGIMVFAFAVLNLTGFRIRIAEKFRFPVGLINGFVAGWVGGLTSINGPFFIMYLVGIDQDRQAFRSSIAFLFLVSGFFISTGLWVAGLVSASVFVLGVVVLIPAFIGMGLGNRVGGTLANQTFRNLVLSGLLIIGLAFIVRSF